MITAPSMYPPVTTGTRGIFAILSIVLFGAGTFDGVFVSRTYRGPARLSTTPATLVKRV
jgi:hypothetical protein